jgi:hypothetical protein
MTVMEENKPRRRWLSFGIRDLLWAMLVVGLAAGLIKSQRDSDKDLPHYGKGAGPVEVPDLAE